MIYSDLDQSAKSLKVEDLSAIHQSIKNILGTKIGERLFNPEFGSTIEDLLFELVTEEVAFLLLTEITRAVGRWEPRVTVNFGASNVIAIPDRHAYNVFLVFNVEGLGREKFEYNFSLRK